MEINDLLNEHVIYDSNSNELLINNDINLSKFNEFIDELYKYESDHSDFRPLLIIDKLPTEFKISIIRKSLNNFNLVDKICILNIFNLVKSWNSFSDSYFKNKYIFSDSIEEFIEIKLACKNELNNFKTNLVKYFISSIKSYVIQLNSTKLIELPNIYLIILKLLSISDIAKLMQDYPVNTDDCGLNVHGIDIVDSFINKTRITDSIHNSIDIINGD